MNFFKKAHLFVKKGVFQKYVYPQSASNLIEIGKNKDLKSKNHESMILMTELMESSNCRKKNVKYTWWELDFPSMFKFGREIRNWQQTHVQKKFWPQPLSKTRQTSSLIWTKFSCSSWNIQISVKHLKESFKKLISFRDTSSRVCFTLQKYLTKRPSQGITDYSWQYPTIVLN